MWVIQWGDVHECSVLRYNPDTCVYVISIDGKYKGSRLCCDVFETREAALEMKAAHERVHEERKRWLETE